MRLKCFLMCYMFYESQLFILWYTHMCVHIYIYIPLTGLTMTSLWNAEEDFFYVLLVLPITFFHRLEAFITFCRFLDSGDTFWRITSAKVIWIFFCFYKLWYFTHSNSDFFLGSECNQLSFPRFKKRSKVQKMEKGTF